ncbi:MAG TPA: prepilin-type N-terminal cleavage/methylation domain-containing protein [Syntrophorhabdaceae bacterium]|nr:prepilin-type N-terminal cleavage/methylation domain-containing protein [Syntrophorhabdaceae bacterium]
MKGLNVCKFFKATHPVNLGKEAFNRKLKKGFTLIELIIFIVIAGLFVPLAYIAFTSVLKSATTPESITKARFLAEQKLEEITKDDFDRIVTNYPPPTSTSYVDIPNNSGYQWKWTIGYITYSGSPPVISDSASPTNYLKIIVYVREPEGYEYVVYTIVTKRPGS